MATIIVILLMFSGFLWQVPPVTADPTTGGQEGKATIDDVMKLIEQRNKNINRLETKVDSTQDIIIRNGKHLQKVDSSLKTIVKKTLETDKKIDILNSNVRELVKDNSEEKTNIAENKKTIVIVSSHTKELSSMLRNELKNISKEVHSVKDVLTGGKFLVCERNVYIYITP